MRRAMPYPCSGPIVSRVLRIMRARVPCWTSVFSGIVFPVSVEQASGRRRRLSSWRVLARKTCPLESGHCRLEGRSTRYGSQIQIEELSLLLVVLAEAVATVGHLERAIGICRQLDERNLRGRLSPDVGNLVGRRVQSGFAAPRDLFRLPEIHSLRSPHGLHRIAGTVAMSFLLHADQANSRI